MRVRFLLCICVILAAVTSIGSAAESTASDADGVLTWTPAQSGANVQGKLKPTRWGMYDVSAQLQTAATGKVKLTIGGKDLSAEADGKSEAVKIGRVYLDTANQRDLSLETEPSDSAKPLAVKSLILTPAPEGKPIVQSGDLSITLHAHDATVHGVNLRYEFRPDKNTLGYWSNPKDWVSWDFEVTKPGKFNVWVMHGSPGTKEIEIAVGDQKLDWTTTKTGSFHTFTFLQVGTLSFDKPGTYTLTLKPAKSVTGSVMDLRQVFLLPILK